MSEDEATDYCLERLKYLLKSQTAPEETAAIVIEPVLGEGGYVVPPVRFMHELRELCDHYGILLVADEVQSGFGRTGKWFAVEHFGITPDILTMAKGIAGGVPMGAIGIDRRVGEIEKQSHTSTFGGNPLACAAAVAAIDVLTGEDLPRRAAETGAYFVERLRAIGSPRIREIRGLGLMIGIELKDKAGPVAQALMQEGVLALLAGTTVLRFLPPLVISREQVDRVVDTLATVLAAGPRAGAE
jgi:acetylornithine/LysW-gamma-L-lysine aminotransferase